MVSSNENRKVFKAFLDDGAGYTETSASKSSEIRKLLKAFSDNPAFQAAVREAKSPAEKHDIIRKAGYTPVKEDELQLELAKALQPRLSAAPLSPEDSEFVGHVAHLAAADTVVNISS